LHIALFDDTDKKRAFCVPPKHKHKILYRRDTHIIEIYGIPATAHNTIARDCDDEIPTTRAATREGYFFSCRRDGSPRVRRMQAAKVSTTLCSTSSFGPTDRFR